MQIITHDLLNVLEKNDELNFLKKEQTGYITGINYFILPKLSIKLYKPKVTFINTKSITFEMSKVNTSLINLLRRCDEMVIDKLNSNMLDTKEKTKYNIFYENDKNDTICIRCYLPCYRSKYLIKYVEENNETTFKLPKLNCILDEVILDIRNIWYNNDKIGYNLELKYIHVY